MSFNNPDTLLIDFADQIEFKQSDVHCQTN